MSRKKIEEAEQSAPKPPGTQENQTIFICPFNDYHRFTNQQKRQFHIQRCGDRRGKTVFACQYNCQHYFCNVRDLADHEINSCPDRFTQKTIYKHSPPEMIQSRCPVRVYCKYDAVHAFTSVAECREHERNECEKKRIHDVRVKHQRRHFEKNKGYIRHMQAVKKQRQSEQTAQNRDDILKSVPNLKYKYIQWDAPCIKQDDEAEPPVLNEKDENEEKRPCDFDYPKNEPDEYQTGDGQNHEEKCAQDDGRHDSDDDGQIREISLNKCYNFSTNHNDPKLNVHKSQEFNEKQEATIINQNHGQVILQKIDEIENQPPHLFYQSLFQNEANVTTKQAKSSNRRKNKQKEKQLLIEQRAQQRALDNDVIELD